MTGNPSTDWDPRDTDVLRNQVGAYDDLRERCPVAYSADMGWSIFRHRDIVDILDDPETFSSETRRRHIPNGMDPPDHTLYRRALEPYFDTGWMAQFEPRGREIAGRIAESFTARDTAEFVSGFAEPYAVEALCAYLGWPASEHDRLLTWIKENQQSTFERNRETGKALALELVEIITDALDARRGDSAGTSGDLTSSLMAVEVEGTRLDDDQIVSILRNWIAGHGTVIASLGNVMHYLAQHAETQRELRGDPSLLPAAIDEILRTDGPLVANSRTTTREVTLGDRTIGAGEPLSLMWIAANRDGKAFDSPGTVRINRDDGQNLVFGMGIHDCVGAPLARMELRLAMEELLARTGTIELAGDAPRRSVFPANGYESLHLRIAT